MNDQYVSVNGLKVRYRDSGGHGPAVLLLHGVGGSLELWSGQFAPANADLRLIAVDLPGHGLSDFNVRPDSPGSFAALLWRVLDALKLDCVHLVGNSLGAAICLQMHSIQPARVLSLLLAAAAALGRETPMPFRLMTLPGLGELMARPGEAAIRQQIQAIFGPEFGVTAEARSLIRRNVMRPGAQRAFLGCIRQMTTLGGQRGELIEQAQASLAASHVPTLLIHGREDAVIPLKHSERTRRRLANVNLIVIDHCGHTPQFEKPGVFNDHLNALVHHGFSVAWNCS